MSVQLNNAKQTRIFKFVFRINNQALIFKLQKAKYNNINSSVSP